MADYRLRDLRASHTTGFVVELEHLKIKGRFRRLTNEKFASVKVSMLYAIGAPSMKFSAEEKNVFIMKR